MLTFKIIDNSHPFYNNIYELYHNSFPVKERRDWHEVEQILRVDKRFTILAFSNDNEYSGFLTSWVFKDFVYVEHFAVSDAKRGKGIGTQIMESFIAKHKLPIVLEVELPETTLAIRRIAFYEELGFSVIPETYLQPPYDGRSDFLPLLIMSSDKDFGENNFDHIKETLYKNVYQTNLELF